MFKNTQNNDAQLQDTLTGIDGYWGIPKWLNDKLEKSDHPYPWYIVVQNYG